MKISGTKILIIDDEPDIIHFLTYNLEKEGFKVYSAFNGKEGIKQVKKVHPHLILLDVMMPDIDGIETCEIIRNDHLIKDTIIVFLTARSEDYSQIAGFEAGGDDYITKPVKPKVLISRIKAILKRYGYQQVKEEIDENVVRLNNIVIDAEKHMVYLDNEAIMLPKKEFTLLQLLTSKPSKVFKREEIFNTIWGEDVIVGDRTIDVYIRKLREKLGEMKIITIKGVGYKFEA